MTLMHTEKADLPKDESLIPVDTIYCYHSEVTEVSGGIPQHKPCIYHDRDKDQPEQLRGYCHFLKKGDWMKDGTMLLWDACKECGIGY